MSRVLAPTLAGALLFLGSCATQESQIEQAATACEENPSGELAQGEEPNDVDRFSFRGTVEDDGETYILDGQGEDAPAQAQAEAYLSLTCMLDELETPEAMRSRMDSTRAMDRRQEYEDSNLLYTWSYHPENGIDMIIEVANME